MTEEPFILIKFLGKPEYADALLEGQIHANTPAFYRTHTAPGVGDPYESVPISVADPEEAANFDFKINDQTIAGIQGFTLHTEPDQYLHCWMAFKKPDDAEGFNRLAKDLARIRQEFGYDYVVLLPQHIETYANQLSSALGQEIECGHVAYSDDPLENSPRCKRTTYAYQREFRFLLGECGNKNETAQTFTVEDGFRDIMLHNAELKLSNIHTGEDFLRLAGTELLEIQEATSPD